MGMEGKDRFMMEVVQKVRYGEASHHDKLDGSSIRKSPVSLELVLVSRTLAHSSIPNSELMTRRVSRQNQKRLLHADDPQGLQGVGTSVGIFSDTRVLSMQWRLEDQSITPNPMRYRIDSSRTKLVA